MRCGIPRASAVARWPTLQLARNRVWSSDGIAKFWLDGPCRGKLRASSNQARPAMKIERIDHLNLTVADIDRSVEFYKCVLGLKAESMGEGRAALYFGQQKIHLDAAKGLDATGGPAA